MTDIRPRSLTASINIAASREAVWRVVADVRRTGEWSPECVSVTPIGRLRAGSFLLGRNRRGRIRWVTLSRVTECEPAAAIAWTVLTNRSRWRYELQTDANGTTVIETRRTPRGESRFALWFTRVFLEGQAVHDDELESGMAAGLGRIKRIVESVPTVGP
ncbi:Polyketide cyclase / dehydrase and lipid transport [Frankineae bacterium MT45]|nr:Polyketide cyclase / dehydrase and lipid transport [Frankineae bacterium MT45]